MASQHLCGWQPFELTPPFSLRDREQEGAGRHRCALTEIAQVRTKNRGREGERRRSWGREMNTGVWGSRGLSRSGGDCRAPLTCVLGTSGVVSRACCLSEEPTIEKGQRLTFSSQDLLCSIDCSAVQTQTKTMAQAWTWTWIIPGPGLKLRLGL